MSSRNISAIPDNLTAILERRITNLNKQWLRHLGRVSREKLMLTPVPVTPVPANNVSYTVVLLKARQECLGNRISALAKRRQCTRDLASARMGLRVKSKLHRSRGARVYLSQKRRVAIAVAEIALDDLAHEKRIEEYEHWFTRALLDMRDEYSDLAMWNARHRADFLDEIKNLLQQKWDYDLHVMAGERLTEADEEFCAWYEVHWEWFWARAQQVTLWEREALELANRLKRVGVFIARQRLTGEFFRVPIDCSIGVRQWRGGPAGANAVVWEQRRLEEFFVPEKRGLEAS